MNLNKLFRNFGFATLAQALSMVLSFVISFLVPKLLGVEEFGYWQLFIFYISYCGFFLLGSNDGVYLIHGGKTYDELNKRSVASQFMVTLVLQAVFALAIALCSLFFMHEEKRMFVIIFTGIYLIFNNLTYYFGYIFQAVNETKTFSFLNVIDKLIFLVVLVPLLLLGTDVFYPYVILYTVAKTIACVWSFMLSRQLFSCGFLPIREAIRDTWESMTVGIKLTVANIAGMLILGVARFVVDAQFGIAEFSQFSFAITLENFFITFITQLSMVLFPALRQTSSEEQRRFFCHLRDLLSITLPIVYVLYLPVSIIIAWWLPAYSKALQYLAILMPVCLFESKMDLLGTTYFKVLREEQKLLRINIGSVALSTVGIVIGGVIMHNMNIVIIAVLCAVIFRSIYSEFTISGKLGVGKASMSILEIALAAVFIFSYRYLPTIVALVAVVIAYVMFILLYRNTVKEFIDILQKLFKKSHPHHKH
ncbi:oligosaccharide flippase family protein [Bifidobacterium sp. MA2]|uniref:Oligosaccharide flippase family protein n=1 Tax=Bifidobacterium santillanense TaxID=2809028 RepID=A0ABS5UQA6_9BIFI|nr:oligosaccharide flippase family protein [Bifidobacterium santillanense]MBT1173160.1 oligosaccharide flippase family protein [Bifidobacterium santillanense]